MVVVEANEVPRRVIEDAVRCGRAPFLGSLLASGQLIETSVNERVPRELYPSQTWASMNTGVAYAEHGVYWYGDPKPARYPLYWQTAARAGRSVGLVNTLHSSPVERQCTAGDYRFVVPDSFSADDHTIPADLAEFQRANLALAGANRRQTTMAGSAGAAAGLARSLSGIGLRADTTRSLAGLVGGALLGRIPRERLRTGQFLIQHDLFLRLLARHEPDLGVLFTNHVAAAMHRYWYAAYPGDFDDAHYDQAWVRRHRDEIPAALAMLDRGLERLHRWCRAADRTLVVVSSMGQGPSEQLCADVSQEAVIVDPGRFLDSLDIHGVAIRGAMAPQLTVDCGDAATAATVATRLADAEVGEVFWDVDGAHGVVTLTAQLEVVEPGAVRIRGVPRSAHEVGVAVYEVDDHSSGRHRPEGILAVANSPTFEPPAAGSIDYLDFAPAVLGHLGLVAEGYHREPAVRL